MTATERDPFALMRADAELMEAEREFQSLEAQIAALRAADADEKSIDPVFDRWMELMDRIAMTPPASLAGCAVKLRTLLHPEIGIETGDNRSVMANMVNDGRFPATGRNLSNRALVES